MRIKLWNSYGVNIKILVGLNAAKQDVCELIMKTAIDQGPVDGIFNLAVSLKDSICRNQTPQTFEESFKGKARATKCLDEVTRKLCPDLRHFVVFSSVSCGRGNAGQTNYGMANSIMERICEKRVEEGFPGLAIQWGAIGDVSLVADMQNEDKELVIGGTLQQKISSCLQELNRFLVQDKSVVASMVVAEKRADSDAKNVVDAVLNILCINCNENDTNEILFTTKMLMQLFGEMLSDEIVIPLKTNPEEGRNEIFLLPGIEGYADIFKTLESKIKSPATCFQLAVNYELKTVEAMANFFLPIAINSFGFGGANAHVLLKSNPKIKVNNELPDDNLPRLVVVSGRTAEAVETILNEIDNRPIDIEFIRLLHDIHHKTIPGHLYRGYVITDIRPSDTKIREIESFTGTKKPICFVFSGMDTQWPGICKTLMKFPTFAKAIEKCDAALKPRKLHIHEILTRTDNSRLDNILHSFVGIAAIQIGLVDLLTSVGIQPDYIIGYSVGELGCAYADGSLTAEETILAAYSQGISVIETEIPHCSVALVGLGYQDITDLCPNDIDVVCHNGPESSTITGSAESIEAFVEKLQINNIFAKVISEKKVPYHSRYIATAKSNLLANLKKVIPVGKPRSYKWLSTSVPQNEWSTSSAQFSSAEYLTNNLLKPVLFEETSVLIPNNAVTIEITSQCQVQEILSKSLQKTVMNIALTQGNSKDNVKVFLEGLGKLYNAGLQPDLAKLYSSVEYPVSRGTPMISPLIRWEHSNDWFITHFTKQDKLISGERIVSIAITDEDFEYINGHVIDGRNLFPATGYLYLVWETLGMIIDELPAEMSIVMENIQFNRATTIPKESKIEMVVMIQKGSGKFEVIEGSTIIVTGMIRFEKNLSKHKLPADVIKKNFNNEEEELNEKDIYKELRLRGYQYSGLFRSLRSASASGRKGHIEWKKNWVAFMDNMLQMKIINLDSRDLYVPTGIQKLVIDTKAHQQCLQNLTTNEKYVPVQFFENIDVIAAGGVEIHKLRTSEIARKKPISDPIIEEYKFIAYRDRKETSLREILTLSMHITLENLPIIKVKTIELIEDKDHILAEKLVSPLLLNILGNLPLMEANVNVFTSRGKFDNIPEGVIVSETNMIETSETASFGVGYGLLSNGGKNSLKKLLQFTKDNGFILSREKKNTSLDLSVLQEFQLRIVLEKRTSEEFWILLKKTNKIAENTMIINVNSNEFSWLEKVQTILASTEGQKINETRILLVEEGNFESGLLGFINCLRKEPGGNIFRAVLIQDLKAPKFSLNLPLYSEQLETDLVVNVLRPGNVWGSYRHQLLPPREPELKYHGIIIQRTRGDLSTFRWIEGPITKDYQNEDLVSIHYSSLNFKDVMFSTGRISANIESRNRKDIDFLIGFEYSGISISGRKVMGFNSNRCLSNFCQLDKTFSWTVPENWSLEDAATVPCIYCTCIGALYINGEMQKGDKILIHAGSGGIGQAAINLALREGCEVFTTVGTPEKRKFIKETFPSIDDNHIGNSRDTSFEKMILQRTNGAGVDIVLNSLAEDKLQASLRCLAHKGRFLEIGKFDLNANNQLSYRIFMKNISFHAVMLDKVIETNDQVKNEISLIFNKLMKENAIKPIIRTIFGKDQVETALRFMAAGKHMGKVLIKIREQNDPLNTPILAEPSYTCIPNKSYIVLGGLGGFGLELIDWLILRNAENIVITSRNGIKNGYQRMRIKLWKSYGVNIKILVGLNAAKRDVCELIVKTAIDQGPVDGIFNLAVSLKDSICRNQTPQTFEESFKGKARATKCLDEVTRKLCPDLRHFVVFSSVSCGRGNVGQTNYGMANSIMERICEKRVEEGFPGLIIQWGAIGDVGLVADMQNEDKELVIGGTLQQKISSCLQELNRFLVQDKSVVASMVVAEKRADSDAKNVVDAVLNILCMYYPTDIIIIDLNNFIYSSNCYIIFCLKTEIHQNIMAEYEKTKKSYKFFKYAKPEQGEEVVISGISGRFPESDNVEELKNNLLNRKDCITDDYRRWKIDHPEIPNRTGKINNIEKFDALFFGIHFKQAHIMDPMNRMILEHTYEAIIDAGINPEDIRGTRTGVFIGTCFSDSETTWLQNKLEINGFGVTSSSRDMTAQNISFWLGITGPSYNVDTACSSSLYAMEHAYRAIRSGQCDYAIVSGSNLCLHPYVSLQFNRLGVLNQDGRCKVFDEDANGYTRSESTFVVFLQKAKTAKRIYATVIHAKANCDGYKDEGITFPSNLMQRTLLKAFYEECDVPTSCISYVEAHGTGTKVGDPVELDAIDFIFNKNRANPLKVGSIKSNIGHTEGVSGICSIAKAIISMETGIIPPNINFNRQRKNVKALTEGRIEVPTQLTPLDGEYIAINSFGFGGANAHVLLKSNPKIKVNNELPDDNLPRLVVVSGRTAEAVETILNEIDNRPIDIEFIRLLHDIHHKTIPGHLYRGYVITDIRPSDTKIREIESFTGTKKPICFVFSGMDTQWPGICKTLMKFPTFAKAIEKCDAALKPRKLHIHEILTRTDNSRLDNILHSFVGIAAIQIGLVDLLTSVGIQPDYIIGYSVGELGCAYADGSLTAEETILAAYSQGISVIETEIPHCSVALVGLGYQDITDLCPNDIDVVCHNGPESSTITGSAESIEAFVEKLQINNIFAKVISEKKVPYHSRYIATAKSNLLANLKKVIPVGKPRSYKWLSTSVPQNEWSTSSAQFSSAEYLTNNLLKPVLFEETSVLIPNNAVTIEITSQCQVQEILSKSLQKTVMNIALTQGNSKDNVKVFLEGLGKLYNAGLQPDLAKLYSSVEYPVSRGTPMISPLIRWEHSNDWFITHFTKQDKLISGERIVSIAITDEDFEYINGHVIDGRNLFPATGYLYLVWETLGMIIDELPAEMSIVMENIQFNRATTIPKESKIEMVVMIQKGSGKFEVIEGSTIIVTGMIRFEKNLSKHKLPADVIKKNFNNEEEELNEKDIYKELRLRGYQYSGLFRSLRSASASGRKGHIEWKKNWVAFMDNMLQMKIINLDSRDLYVPTGIQKLVIDTKAHQQCLQNLTTNEKYVPVQFFENIDVIAAGGVEIHKLRTSEIARKKPISDPIIEEYKFIAYRDRKETSLREILTLSMHITLENLPIIKVKTIELIEDKDHILAEKLVSPLLLNILGNLPLMEANVNVFTSRGKFDNIPEGVIVSETNMIETSETASFGVGYGLLSNGGKNSLKKLLQFTKDNGFILSREKKNTSLDLSVLQEFQLRIVLEKRTSEEFWILLKKTNKIAENTMIINVNSNEFSWLEKVQTILASTEGHNINETRILLVEEGNFESGLLGFINCLRKEPGGNIFRAVLIQDLKAPKFSLNLPLYSEQLETDLVVNVLRPGNVWGSYRHQLLPPREPELKYHGIIIQRTRGDLSTFRWIEGPITKDYRNEDLVSIHYSSLNFKDVMFSTGRISANIESRNRKDIDFLIGFEYSGISISGRKVMGFNSNRCLSNFCQLDKTFSWTVPENWSLEDAATVPCIYCTCIGALYINGEMQKGDKILIHAGSGGIGQAAINLALREGCEVFTTVGTPEKRKFIKETFPSIDDNHIGNSRDTSFEKMILQRTNGAGVDIVLNSLAEDKLQASLRCLAHKGRFLEIGKFDLNANNQLSYRIFMKNISFHAVMLDKVIETNDQVKNEISLIFNKLMKENAIKPIIRTIFGKDQVETALRFMAAGKHMGKVLIKIREQNDPLNTPILAEPSYTCIPNKSYIVLGGLGGFGLELIDWLILRNAENIVITSRNGIKNGYQRMRIKLWKSYGVNIKILVGLNAAKRDVCELIVKTAIDQGPVDGIFNLAVSLKDSICRNQTPQTFEESFKGKARATKCLDEVTRKLCPDLRHFVVFSSVSCGRGNVGQTNYGMANSIMERICEKRVEEGFPGLAIQWGAIGDVGLVADMQNEDKELVIGGTLQQKISSCLQELNRFLVQDKSVVASMVVAEKRANSDAKNVVDAVLNILCIRDLKNVSPHTSLAELGMDSMTAVEIKQTLEREYEIYLTAPDIRNLNFAKLMEMNNKTTNNSNCNENDTNEILFTTKMLMQLFGEILSDEIVIPLKTNPEGGRNEIFLLPGIEGYADIFKTLESKIKSPATCFQLAVNYELKTVEAMANFFLPHILDKLKDRSDFVLVGYSFGSLVAIELTRKLEAKGFIGRLILIDGAPQHLKMLIHQHLHSASQEVLENNILVAIMNAYISVKTVEFELELRNCSTWDERVNAFFNVLSPEHKELFLKGNQKKAILSFNVRLQSVIAYNPEPMPYIRTPITLFKPLLPSVQNAQYDYGLQNITEAKVDVHTVEGNHVTMLDAMEISMAINGELFDNATTSKKM
ncbi:fatty acid synthase-like [Vespula squamosa]|uniref:Fatty acid synthase-like n=1 Tax=Vespula squamosa TaxID=30214 RepID=A0ABD2A5Q7_VESSQ